MKTRRQNRINRRDFLKLTVVAMLDFVLLAMAGAVYSLWIEPGRFKVETVRLRLRRLSPRFSGIRIVQISDIHMGGWMNRERLQRVADLVRAEKPDALLITGDFLIGHGHIDISHQVVGDLIAGLTPLASSVPTLAVLGNHDYWTNPEAVRYVFNSTGIRDLTNKVFTLEREGENLHFCGVDDIWEGDVRLDIVIAQLSDDGAAILLAHEPDFADTSAETGRFDLQVSGHSHGGQVVLPLLGPPVLPRLGRKYPGGLYQVANMFQYTNRGVGTANLPVRFNCPPEITVFVLEGAAALPAT
ncbi:MAG: metallophosphoesterase [Chloroflexota bacterium]|nr:metallophosphoesterase [Chloroflexota bacterium]